MGKKQRARAVRQTTFGIAQLRRVLLRRPEQDRKNGHISRYLAVNEVGYFLMRGTPLQRLRAQQLLLMVLTNGVRRESYGERCTAFRFLAREEQNRRRRKAARVVRKVQRALVAFRAGDEFLSR